MLFLAHPNTIAFITHGGLLSVTEAIHYGVPMITIPVFGDQIMNSVRIEKNGIAERLDFLDLTENKIYEAVRKVTTNPE